MKKKKNKCIFNENHELGNKGLDHYITKHKKEYDNCINNGWFCKHENILFPDTKQTEKHNEKCIYCQSYNNNKDNNNSLSKTGKEEIEKKLPIDKKNLHFSFFDFDKIKNKQNGINLDLELIKALIEDEKNIIF